MRDPRTVTEPSSVSMRWMVLVVAYILVALFIIGVFDVLLSLVELLMSQNYTEPSAVVTLIDEVLLLLIIVEIHRLILAYIRQDPVIQIVINVGIIAVAREIISFRIAEYGATSEALFGAAALAVLLLVLVFAFFILYRTRSVDEAALPNWGEVPYRDDIPDRFMGDKPPKSPGAETDGGDASGPTESSIQTDRTAQESTDDSDES